MGFSPGDTLGAYEISAPIGAGGMGEVYKARDPRLQRDVAIKVLPASHAADPDYRLRLEREAQVLASLSHPNIAMVYGIQDNAIIMEFVEGKTLQTPLPIAEALAIARQIAEALEAAHDKGVIHRDLKTGNIKLTPDGQVKVLDFGLAKNVERAMATSVDSPTLRATEAGVILGTAGYMSPEQAAGKTVDRRADIWSFGVVLYEMLTGSQLFSGETVAHVLAAVLRADIDLSQLPSGTPPRIHQLLRRCLDRNLKTRLAHIAEARIAIDNLDAAGVAPVSDGKAPRLPWVLAGVFGVAAAATFAYALLPPQASAPVTPSLLEVTPPPGAHFAPMLASGGSALSPDGQKIAFTAVTANGPLLHTRRLDSLEARAWPGTEGSSRPFWSPDSQSVAFTSGSQLQRIDLGGSAALPLAPCLDGRGGDWSRVGSILFACQTSPLFRVPATGGEPEVAIPLEGRGDGGIYYPQRLPGNRLLYVTTGREMGMYVRSLAGGPATRLDAPASSARYDPESGYLLFVQARNTLVARKLELEPPKLTGELIVIATGVGFSSWNSYGEFSLSGNGSLLYGHAQATRGRFAWRNRNGQILARVGPSREAWFSRFQLHPDETRVLYGDGGDRWYFDLKEEAATRLTFRGARSGLWSPDGRYLYFLDEQGLQRKAMAGSAPEELVRKLAPQARDLWAISPDGRHLVLGIHIRVIDLTTGSERPLGGRPTTRADADFSPDGRWLAYVASESGIPQVYVVSFPSLDLKQQVSVAGGNSPRWRPDGKELYFQAGDQLLAAAADYPSPSQIRLAKPEALFTLSPNMRAEPSRDGSRFLTVEPDVGDKPPDSLVLMQNWRAKLPR